MTWIKRLWCCVVGHDRRAMYWPDHEPAGWRRLRCGYDPFTPHE